MARKRQNFNNREAVIDRLRSRDGDHCWLCQTRILFWPDRDDILGSETIDHVMPLAHGGGNEDENPRLAHYLCNNVRGASIDADEIKARIATLFEDGKPAPQARRRQLLIASVGSGHNLSVPREPLHPFCAWPKREEAAIWPCVGENGQIFMSSEKPAYLH